MLLIGSTEKITSCRGCSRWRRRKIHRSECIIRERSIPCRLDIIAIVLKTSLSTENTILAPKTSPTLQTNVPICWIIHGCFFGFRIFGFFRAFFFRSFVLTRIGSEGIIVRNVVVVFFGNFFDVRSRDDSFSAGYGIP